MPRFVRLNRFHVAVCLFSYRRQMMTKCGKNKQVAHEPLGECVANVLKTPVIHLPARPPGTSRVSDS